MKPGLLGEMADARAGEGRHKISLKSFCTRKEESTQRMMGCDQKKKKRHRSQVEASLFGQIRDNLNFSTSSPTLVLFVHFVLFNSHPAGCVVVSYCSFDVHFLNN